MTQPFDNRDWDMRQITEKDAEIERLKALLGRAADALDIMTQFLLVSDVPLEWEENRKLIAELREAAE